MSERPVPSERGVPYGTGGGLLDVHRPAGASAPSPTVLLWHGRGPDKRDALAPLAREAASLGLTVVVPGWHPDAPDGGLRDLLESVRFARERAGGPGGGAGRVLLAGWSLGARIAVDVMLRPDLVDGWRPMGVVGVAGRYDSGRPEAGIRAPEEELARRAVSPVPVHLVHGTADPVVPARRSREFAAALRRWDWPVAYTETGADHAGVVMTEYDPGRERSLPARTPRALEAGRLTARVLARAAGLAAPPD
ncbi:alpha/beta hydrolase [Streptomyces sp. DH37]|uniref:alpha/beta hydrolase n=1 Tax=Streptomyces sp. DH37 TaxID=3040122 RepID=UPI002441065D|nr:alpha/beta hydrolase [Streptomyces sp. DH37]MDG9704506.1 alpha/beta hydrolase [Streptomyces sp. DH37]